MTILPTLEGGLRLQMQVERDWQVLMALSFDASHDLAGDLSGLMDEESMWEDLIEPELRALFSHQVTQVEAQVRAARKGGESSITIGAEDADVWYGALNQARLAMEANYQFGPTEEGKSIESMERGKQEAFFRERFYCQLQSLLLEYVME